MADGIYATPAAFDRAVKKAARASGADPGEAYRQALRDRFLCRVFYGGNESFVLKGGSGMLARIPDARATKDLDFASRGKGDASSALEEMKRVAALDLGDWCSFRLTKADEALDENGYSRLLKLRFATFVGMEEKDPILIDLSLDCATTLPPERIVPVNRLDIAGVQTSDYLVYPLPDQLADKLCAIMELTPSGYPSSRMKDLVDVVTYVTNRDFQMGQLRVAIESECAKRGMPVPVAFAAPESWAARFDAFAAKCDVVPAFATLGGASGLAASFFDPVLQARSPLRATWDSTVLRWVDR